MEESKFSKFLYWLPRVLALMVTAFFIGFVFLSHGFTLEGLIESVVWLAILIITLIAWKWEGVGGLIFILLGVIYITMTWGRFSVLSLLFTAGPIILVGILFIISKYRK